MRKAQRRDPLAPIEFALAFASGLIGLLFLALTVWIALGDGELRSEVCVTIHQGTAATVSDQLDHPRPAGEGAFPSDRVLPAGTTVHARSLDVCAKDPTLVQRAVSGVDWLLRFLLFAVPIGMGWRLVRLSREQGVFSASVAKWLTVLGWWIVLAPAAFSLCILLTQNWLIDQLLPGGAGQPVDVPQSWGTLLTGFGILTLGRVMARAVSMQDELDATV